MKKLIFSVFVFLSALAYSQDTIRPKKFSLGVGVSRVLGWGQNTNISYAASKKFSIKLRGIYGVGNEELYNQQTSGVVEKTNSFDVSVSANYYLLGNTRPDSKVGLYIGLGLGYLSQQSNHLNLNPGYYSGVQTSFTDNDFRQGLATGVSLGASVKAGPGKIYAEGYLSIGFIGNEVETLTSYSNYPSTNIYTTPSLHVYKDYDRLSNRNGYVGIICFNLGYAIPF